MIAFFDLETTGKSTTKDRIVQISAIKTDLNFNIIDKPRKILINPTIPIPAEATAIHGITDEMVKDAPTFDQLAKSMLDYFIGMILAGYNIRKYDIPLLVEELLRCSLELPLDNIEIIDGCHIFHQKQPRDLSAAVKFYAGYELINAHDAEADNKATIDVIMGQSIMYGLTVPDMVQMCKRDETALDFDGKLLMKDGVAVFASGKHAGKPVINHKDYVIWMLGADFSNQTKNIAKAIAGIK